MWKRMAYCLMVLYGVTLPCSAWAQASRPATPVPAPCAAEEAGSPSLPVTAIVSRIDQRRGRATLETSVGQLELAAAPDELQVLQTGDVLTLCVDPAALSGTDTTASPSLS